MSRRISVLPLPKRITPTTSAASKHIKVVCRPELKTVARSRRAVHDERATFENSGGGQGFVESTQGEDDVREKPDVFEVYSDSSDDSEVEAIIEMFSSNIKSPQKRRLPPSGATETGSKSKALKTGELEKAEEVRKAIMQPRVVVDRRDVSVEHWQAWVRQQQQAWEEANVKEQGTPLREADQRWLKELKKQMRRDEATRRKKG